MKKWTAERVGQVVEAENLRLHRILAEYLPPDQIEAALAEVREQMGQTIFAAFQLKAPTESVDNVTSIILIQVLARRLNLDLKIGPDLSAEVVEAVSRYIVSGI